MHFGCKEKSNKNYSFNLAIIFDSILNDIIKSNEINCIYNITDNQNEIQLLHDYNDYILDEKKSYLKAKELNKKIFEEEIELHVNGEKIPFSYNYKITDEKKEIKVKFKFKKRLNSMSYMFYYCSNLTNINLSSFDTKNITDMSYIFWYCSNLTNINLSSVGTKNVTNMSKMFFGCSNLTNIDLSYFNTKNVTNISDMFYYCSNLTNINFSSFDTKMLII